MSKKRYITIQIIPDDSSDAWTIKLRYRFFEFLFYTTIIALFAIALAAVKITEINGKVLTSGHLYAMNQQLLEKQTKMSLLEQKLGLMSEQERKIRGIIETFIIEKELDSTENKNEDRMNHFSQMDLEKYIADIHAIEKKKYAGKPRSVKDDVPDIWPVAGIISQGYKLGNYKSENHSSEHNEFMGKGSEGKHEGVDIIAENNALVMSAARGTVIQSGQDRDLGRYVKIDHALHYQTLYAHLSRTFVQIGDRVEKGTTLGIIGNSGNSFGPHLHYEIEIRGRTIDPQLYLK